MLGYAETGKDFEQGPGYTDEGFEIISHALNGDGESTVIVAPPTRIYPDSIFVAGVEYTFSHYDSYAERAVFARKPDAV